MAGRIAYLGNIATQGLVLDLDAAIQGSYPKTGSLWTDISGNNNNGTLTNGPVYTGSDYGAIVFDGVNDYVNIPTFNQTFSSLTLGTWIKLAGSQSNFAGVIYSRGGGGSTTGLNFIGSIYGGNGYKLGLTYNDTGFTTPGPELLDNTWTQVYLAFSPTSTVYYINGSPSLTLPSYGSTTTLSSLKLGYDTDTATRVFKGSMAQAQIYNQALSQFQVWQNFNAYKSRYGIPDIVTDGLVLNLDAGNPYSYLSGSSGTTWSNTVAVSSSISGTLVNGTTYSNGAMVFDGVDDWITLPTGSTFAYGTGDFAIECWFKDTSATSVPYSALYAQTISGTNYYILGVDTVGINGRVYWIGTSSGGGTPIYASGSYLRNTWNHVVASRISGVVTVYLNGSGGTPTSNTLNFTNTTYVPTIGDESHHGSSNSWTGNIPVIRLYTGRGLTSTEVSQNFNALRGRYGI